MKEAKQIDDSSADFPSTGSIILFYFFFPPKERTKGRGPRSGRKKIIRLCPYLTRGAVYGENRGKPCGYLDFVPVELLVSMKTDSQFVGKMLTEMIHLSVMMLFWGILSNTRSYKKSYLSFKKFFYFFIMQIYAFNFFVLHKKYTVHWKLVYLDTKTSSR